MVLLVHDQCGSLLFKGPGHGKDGWSLDFAPRGTQDQRIRLPAWEFSVVLHQVLFRRVHALFPCARLGRAERVRKRAREAVAASAEAGRSRSSTRGTSPVWIGRVDGTVKEYPLKSSGGSRRPCAASRGGGLAETGRGGGPWRGQRARHGRELASGELGK